MGTKVSWDFTWAAVQRGISALVSIVGIAIREGISTRKTSHARHQFCCCAKVPSTSGTLPEERVFAYFVAPLPDADLFLAPLDKLFSTDASPSRAVSCEAKVSFYDWIRLYDCKEELGECVRLDWERSTLVETEIVDV